MSNLLDKASIILTPTAYNNGEALCVKPSDGSGDFDFSRNSAATRVNAQGLVENVQILSSNLVQNGDFSEEGVEEVSNGSFSQEGSELITNGNFSNGSTDWILDSGWSVSDNKALCDGTNLAYITQTAVLTTGKSYKVQFDIVDYTSGSIKYRDNGFVSGQSFSGVGSYTDYVVAGGGQFRLMSENFIGSIDNVSVREVAQNWSLGTGWSIGEDKAIFNGAGFSPARTNAGLVTGKTYKVTFDLDITSGNVVVQLGGATNTFNTSTTHTFYDTATANGAYSSFVSLYSSLTSNFSITNISVKEVGQNWDLTDQCKIEANKAKLISTDGSSQNISQLNTLVVGKKYKLEYEVTDNNSGEISMTLSFGVDYSNLNSSVGTHSIIAEATNTTLQFKRRSGVTDISITNISVIEITDDTNLPRINYENFSYQDALGSEEIVNGTFNDGSNWTTLGGWSIGGGSANCNGGSIMYTNGGIEVSKTYKVTYTIINYVSGNVRSIFNGSTTDGNGTTRNSNGTFTELVQSTDNASGTFSFGAVAGSFVGSIDNVSVKEYLGQSVVPDSGCGSWLWENQSTNLITYSEDFSQWNNSDITIGANGISPSGEVNANLIQTGTTGGDQINEVYTLSATNTVTQSIYIKRVSGAEWVDFLIVKNGFSNSVKVWFNINTGQVGGNIQTGTTILDSALIKDFGNGWYRLKVTTTDTTNNTSFNIRVRTAAADLSDTRVNNSSYYLWGATLEAQSYATSYIPTEGATVTRNQDVCNSLNIPSLLGQTEGAFFIEVNKSVAGAEIFSFNRSTSNSFQVFTNNSYYRYIRYSENTTGGGITDIPFTDTLKLAMSYKNGEFKSYANGTLIENITDFTWTPNVALANLYFNKGGYVAANEKSEIKALAVWKEALSDSELQSLTTI